MVNPKTKGSSFERLVAKALEDFLGIRFDRNPFEQQRQANQPDLVTRLESWPFSIECKRYKVGSFVPAWWMQSKSAAEAHGTLPCVIYKFDRQPIWVAVSWEAIGAMNGVEYNEDDLVFMNLESFAFVAREIMSAERISNG